MAALGTPTVMGSGGGGGQPRWVVLAFPRVTVGDTYDISALNTNTGGLVASFQTVFSALFVATSNRTATTTLATASGTVITINGSGVSADTGLLFVVGE